MCEASQSHLGNPRLIPGAHCSHKKVSIGGAILLPHFDPTSHAQNRSELPCDDACIQKSAIRGFTLTNEKRKLVAVHFSVPEEYSIAVFCFWLRCLDRNHIAINNKPDLRAFLAEQFESEALQHIITFIFKSKGDITFTPLWIEA